MTGTGIRSRGLFTKYKAIQKPWMDEKEIALIRKYLQPGHIMLEWGSGGSTFYFSQFVQKYYSIESDQKWGKIIRRRVLWSEFWVKVLRGRKEPKIIYHPVKMPVRPRTIPTRYEDYRDFIERVDHLGVKRFDVVLIDGRGRDHCAKKILDYIDEKSVVFIHDYFMPGREYYSEVLQWYDILEAVTDTPQTLVALRKK
jgi:hypothetical protein